MHLVDLGTRSFPCKGRVAPATFAMGRDGERVGLRGSEEIPSFAPIPLPTAPLKGEELLWQPCPLIGIPGSLFLEITLLL